MASHRNVLAFTYVFASFVTWVQATEEKSQSYERLAIGITVIDSPGTGVLVRRALFGGPAYRSGIRSEDFLMSVAGRPIDSPADLKNELSKATDKHIEVTIWRSGETMRKTLVVDSKWAEIPRSRGWLGVKLRTTRNGNVLIVEVLHASPAEDSGIRRGDIIVRLNIKKIDSVEELMAFMRDVRSGDDIDVTVLRDGVERTMTVNVGSAFDRTMRWLNDRIPLERLERRFEDQLPDVEEYINHLENTLKRMRRDMREWRNEDRRIRRSAPDEVVEEEEGVPEKLEIRY